MVLVRGTEGPKRRESALHKPPVECNIMARRAKHLRESPALIIGDRLRMPKLVLRRGVKQFHVSAQAQAWERIYHPTTQCNASDMAKPCFFEKSVLVTAVLYLQP